MTVSTVTICQGAFFNEIHKGMLRMYIEEGAAGEILLRAAKEVLARAEDAEVPWDP